MRHGESTYSEIFPDLTPLGITQVIHTGEVAVTKWLLKNGITPETFAICSSPALRAQGTAHVLRNAIGLQHLTSVVGMLGPMQWRDPARCKKALMGLSGRGYIDYETEPVFADPELFETPEEIRHRWYDFFTDLIMRTPSATVFMNYLLVSHYEVFCHIVHDLFGIVASEATALQNAETIELSIAKKQRDTVVVSGCFRGISRVATFGLKQRSFVSE